MQVFPRSIGRCRHVALWWQETSTLNANRCGRQCCISTRCYGNRLPSTPSKFGQNGTNHSRHHHQDNTSHATAFHMFKMSEGIVRRCQWAVAADYPVKPSPRHKTYQGSHVSGRSIESRRQFTFHSPLE